MRLKWDKVFKNGPNAICGRQPFLLFFFKALVFDCFLEIGDLNMLFYNTVSNFEVIAIHLTLFLGTLMKPLRAEL